jgi:hypothetical protein
LHSLPLHAFYKVRPKTDVLQLVESRQIASAIEFPLEIISQILSVIDHVRLTENTGLPDSRGSSGKYR